MLWTETQLVEDLQALGLAAGDNVLLHASLPAIGDIAGGAETLLNAFRRTLGTGGTLLVPTFSFDHLDPADWKNPPATHAEQEKLRALMPAYHPEALSEVRWMDLFPELTRQQPDAHHSAHPLFSFAAIGANADFLTQNASFHYPLGSGSPLARLHQIDGKVLLLGVSHRANTSVHLAEIWAEAPYVNRSTSVKTGPDEWTSIRGSAECGEGFGMIEPLLRHSRLLREGYVGNAPCQLIRQRPLVSMAIAIVQGDGSALLCQDPACAYCVTARKQTAEQRL